MAKQTFYFSHDYNARGDRKMVSLLMNCGVEGVGIYWCIIEMLYEEGGYMMLSECERIAFELRTQSEKVQRVLESSLFQRDDEKFWSDSAINRLQKRHSVSNGASKAAEIRWNNARKNKNMQTHNGRNANKGKENKGKDIKINKRCYTDADKLQEDAAAAFLNYFSSFEEVIISEKKIRELARQLSKEMVNEEIENFNSLIKGWAKKFISEKSNGLHKEVSEGADVGSPL